MRVVSLPAATQRRMGSSAHPTLTTVRKPMQTAPSTPGSTSFSGIYAYLIPVRAAIFLAFIHPLTFRPPSVPGLGFGLKTSTTNTLKPGVGKTVSLELPQGRFNISLLTTYSSAATH